MKPQRNFERFVLGDTRSDDFYLIVIYISVSQQAGREPHMGRDFLLWVAKPRHYCLMGHQIVFNTVLWVANYRRLRATDFDA